VREITLAAFALLGLAAQVGYWQHFQRKEDPTMGAGALAQACAGLFLKGAASIPIHQGGSHA